MIEEKIKFIDLFAGIGGFHYALHQLGCECVFASELDESARITYERNFSRISPDLFANNMFNDDIRKISPIKYLSNLICQMFLGGNVQERSGLRFVLVVLVLISMIGVTGTLICWMVRL